MSHPCTCLESRKKDNISKSGIKRTEWKTMTLFVSGIGIWNLRNPKIEKAHFISDGALFDASQESAIVISFP